MNRFGLSHDYPLMKRIPLVKVELDETGEIAKYAYGIMAAATPDKEGEMLNYAAAKKNIQAWSDEAANATAKAGQDLSLGNIRLQHTLTMGGKATKLDFDDAAKTVRLGSVPLNDEVGKQLKQGFFTGYSIGGDYEWRRCATCAADISKGSFCKACGKNVLIEYSPLLAETSYVDNPAHQEAHFELVKADGSKQLANFAISEADMDKAQVAEITQNVIEGVMKQLRGGLLAKEAKTKRKGGKDLTSDCFAYVGDKGDPSTWKLPIKSPDGDTAWEKSHIKNALARFDQTQGIPADEKAKVKGRIDAAAKKHDIEVSDEVKKADVVKAFVREQFDALCKGLVGEDVFNVLMKSDKLVKGMYEVGTFAMLMCDLAWIQDCSAWEAAYEGDDSQIPYELIDNLEALAETFLAMAEEEVGELTAASAAKTGGNKIMKTLTAAELVKAAKPLSEHISAAKAAVTDHVAKMCKAQDEHCDKMKKLHKAHGDEMTDTLGKCMKLMGAEEADKDEASKSGANEPEPINVIAEGTESLKAAETLLLAKGFKITAPESTTMSREEIRKAIEDGINSGIQAFAKASKKEDDGDGSDAEDPEDEKKDGEKKKTKKAAGIGDRANVPMLSGSGGVVTVMPVIKTRDSGGASGEQPNNAAASAATPAVSRETVQKALQGGDVAAGLELMKGSKPAAVPATILSSPALAKAGR
jgi:hypothetical protein